MLKSIGGRLKEVKSAWSRNVLNVFKNRDVDDDFWENLEDILITGDVSLDLVDDLIRHLKLQAWKKNINNSTLLLDEFSKILTDKLSEIEGMGQDPVFKGSPSVLILVGVNGSGKTTSAGKLALKYKNEGSKVLLAAADTYRAAAVEQLKIWGERSDIRVIAQKHGSDPAAVVFDAVSAGRNGNADIIIVDTAGRLHSKHNLMEELIKINRIARKEAGADNVSVALVLDSVMGQNGFRQAEAFHSALDLDGIILTKYDTTAKGGIILTIADKLKLPIRYIGLGESVSDLTNFEPGMFIKSLLEIEQE